MSDETELQQAVVAVPTPTLEPTPAHRPRMGDPAPAALAMILLDAVTKTYEPAIVGLDDVSVQIDKGEFVFLVGPSGSGKSTFIKLLPNRSVYQNVAYALQVQGKSRTEIRKKVPDIIGLVGLADKSDRFPHELSGGEQQRVSVARAFVNHPPLLIADEPTGNLDPDTSVGIMQLLYRINRAGTTVVMATHDREMVDKMRRRVIQLEDGKVVRDDRRGGYEG